MDGGMQIRCVLGQRQQLYFLISQLGCIKSSINEDKLQGAGILIHARIFIHFFFSVRTVAVTLGHLQMQNPLSGS